MSIWLCQTNLPDSMPEKQNTKTTRGRRALSGQPDKSRLLAELRARMLAELPPDERERVITDPDGPEALTFAVSVYVRAGYPNQFENLKKPEL
jgi:hypothetical protein